MSDLITREEFIRILTRYEGAVGEVERDGNVDELPKLEAARAELMKLLQRAKVVIDG